MRPDEPEFLAACARSFQARRAAERARHARRGERLREQAKAAAVRLVRELGASRVWLFGSLVWGEPHEASDVDLLVEGLPRDAWSRAHALCEQIAEAPVDLVRLEEAAPGLPERVQAHGVLLDAV